MDTKGVGAAQVGKATGVGEGPAFAADKVYLPELLLSQSGSIATAKDGDKQKPLVPGLAGQFQELVVTGLSPSGTRFENHFPVDDKGMLHWAQARPLGHVPYEVTLVGKDGARYSGVVDITPKAVGKSHSGYEVLTDLELSREKPPPPASLQVPELLLSQSGSIATAKDGQRPRPLVPGMNGKLKELVVTGMSPSGTRFENRFPIDANGVLQWNSAQPLGHVPYRLELHDGEGHTWGANVDISPQKLGKSHAGYEVLNDLRFVLHERPPAAEPPLRDRQGLRNFATQKPLQGERTSPLQAFWKK